MKLARQMAEDRALRDAALALFKADLRFVRNDLERRGLGERVADRLGDGAKDLVDDAVDYAGTHKGVLAAAVAAAVLWFARAPILNALFGASDDDVDDDDDAEPEGGSRRSSDRST